MITSLTFFPLQVYWDIFDIQHCVSLGCTVWWLDAFIYCRMMTTIALAITSIMSHSCHFFSVVGTFNIYSDDFPDGPVDKIPNFHWRGCGVKIPCALRPKKKKKLLNQIKMKIEYISLKKLFKKDILINFPVFHIVSLALITITVQ